MSADSCDLCSRPLSPGEHYVVRIEVFADPAMPATTSAALQTTDFNAVISQLLDDMKNHSTEELQDQVHRRFEYKICHACQTRFLANPLGKPRVNRSANN